MDLHQCGLMGNYSLLWVIIQFSCYWCCCVQALTLATGSSSDHVPRPSKVSLSFCGLFLTFWLHKVLQDYLVSPPLSPPAALESITSARSEGLFFKLILQISGRPSGHIWLWELDHKEGGVPKNWCLRTVVLEKTLGSPLDSKEIKPVNLKGNQSWILVGRTDAEAEAPVFWSSDANSRLTGKVPDAGKDWGQKGKRVSEDVMAGQHHRCNEHELGQTPGNGEGEGGLACCMGLQRVRHDWATE